MENSVENIPQYIKDWNFIKSISWDRFPKRRIYIDDEDHFMCMRRMNGTIAICGYLYCRGRMGRSSFAYNFYIDLLEFGKKYKEAFDICIVTNFAIWQSDYIFLEKFPEDFKFYSIRNNKLELQDLKRAIESSKINNKDLVVLRDPNTKLIVSEIKNKSVDSEENIMRGLRDGYGENYGFE
ncbi:MAG: hypothetical protein N4A59_13355 [Marinifilum sp.]|jgi:hypothetical protein|nr:hypothetical protein [Marinifilum sp.]